MIAGILAACINNTHFPGFSPVNQSCLACDAAGEVPVAFACGCPGLQEFALDGSFTCPPGGCAANEPFSGVNTCPTASNHQTTCPAGQASGYRGNALNCGHLRYSPGSNADKTLEITLCGPGEAWISEFQICWPSGGPPNVTEVALSLCALNFTTENFSIVRNGLACEYIFNLCAEQVGLCNNSDLYRLIGETDTTYLPRVKDYAYEPFKDAATRFVGNENYYNLSFGISRKGGEILMKSRLAYESLDFCSITEAGFNPIFERIHRFYQVDQKDRRWDFGLISRYKMHRETEMVRRNNNQHIQLLGDDDFKFGQKYRKQCRIGHAILQRFAREYGEDPLYVTFYAGDYSITQLADGVASSERIIPINHMGTNYFSFPLWKVNDTDLLVVSKMEIIIHSSKALTASHPVILFETQEIPRLVTANNVTESSILNRVTSKITEVSRRNSFSSTETNFVDFNYTVRFEHIDPVDGMATRTAVLLVMVWFVYLLYGMSQARKLIGLNGACQNASARVISYVLTIMCLGVGTAFLVDMALQGMLRVASPISFLADGLNQKQLVETSVLVGSIMFIVIQLIEQLFSVPALRFVILDHGDPEYYYRRFFVANSLNKVLKERFYPLTFAYSVAFVLLYAFDLCYADGERSYISITPHASEPFSRIGIAALVLLCSNALCAIITQTWRFFERETAYDKLVDVLPLAGCSVLVFDSPYSAFLLYGSPIYGDCDASGAVFTRNLLNEAESLTPRRGMNGKSAESFRIYFNEDCQELTALYTTAQQMCEFQPRAPAQCGQVAIQGAQDVENSRLSFKIDAFTSVIAEKLAEQEKLMPAVLELIQTEPVRYTAKLSRIFDFNLAAENTQVLVISDPTRNFSPHAADTGNMLPGGLGGPAWISKAFWYSHWWFDLLFGAAIMYIIGYITGNIAAGLVCGWVVTELWSRACICSMRRALGMGSGCSEGMMV